MTDAASGTKAAGLHLWEPEHPYYCASGNFFKVGYHSNYPTWGDFIATAGGWDLDMDLLFRWDWHKPDAGVMGTLSLYFVRQRKGYNYSIDVQVHPDEEPEVRTYLQARLDHLLAMWAPLTTTATAVLNA